MAKNIKPQEGVFVDVFIVVIGAILVITGYLIMVLMSSVQDDNVARGVLFLALLVIISTMVQLASLAMLGKIRENVRGNKK